VQTALHPALDYLARLVRQGGPTVADHALLDFHLGQLAEDLERDAGLRRHWALLRPTLLGGRSPEGGPLAALLDHADGALDTPGLVAALVAHPGETHDAGNAWDRYLMRQPLPAAYRLRHEVLLERVEALLEQREEIRVLHGGAGLGQDLLRLYEAVDPWRCGVTAHEPDAAVRARARERTLAYAADLDFPEPEAFGRNAPPAYDLIWLPWCLDRLDDAAFITATNNLANCLMQGGEIIYCHTHPDVAAGAAARVLGSWRPFGRTREHLLNLILQTGIADRVRFLHCDERGGEVVVRVVSRNA
jgi:hypothetical protein